MRDDPVLAEAAGAVSGPEATHTVWRRADFGAGIAFGLSTWRITYETVVSQVSGQVGTATSAQLASEIDGTCVRGASHRAGSARYRSRAVRGPPALLGLTDLFLAVSGWDAALAEEAEQPIRRTTQPPAAMLDSQQLPSPVSNPWRGG